MFTEAADNDMIGPAALLWQKCISNMNYTGFKKSTSTL